MVLSSVCMSTQVSLAWIGLILTKCFTDLAAMPSGIAWYGMQGRGDISIIKIIKPTFPIPLLRAIGKVGYVSI